MTTFVSFDGASPPRRIPGATGTRSPSPRPSPPRKIPAGPAAAAGDVAWEAQSQLTDDFSYYTHDQFSSSSDYSYRSDEDGDIIGDFDDLKRTFSEALQLIGVGPAAAAAAQEEEQEEQTSPDRRRSRSADDRDDRRHRRRQDGRRRRRKKRGNRTKKDRSSWKERGPVADSPIRSTPSRPRRRTPSASIMKKPSRDAGAASSGTGAVIVEEAPSPPTLVDWSEAYGNDRELQVVKILMQNDQAKEAYLWQVSQEGTGTDNKDQNQDQDRSEANDKEEAADSPSGGTFRLSLHNELISNQLQYDPADSMLYFIENIPQSTSDARSAHDAPTQSNKTNRLRIVPQSLRRQLFQVALYQTHYGASSGAFSVFHRLRSSYYWDGMYTDVHRWWADCGAQVAQMSALADVAKNTPTRPFDEKMEDSPYRVADELRVTFSLDQQDGDDTNKFYGNVMDNDDINTTQDTCLDVTMDTDDGKLMFTPPASPAPVAASNAPDPPGSAASAATPSKKKKNKSLSSLRKAMRSLSPTPTRKSSTPKASPVPAAKRAASPFSDGSVTVPASNSGPNARAATPATPTNLSDAPPIVRRNSFISLFRSKSKDHEDENNNSSDDAAKTPVTTPGRPPQPSSVPLPSTPSPYSTPVPSAQNTPIRRPKDGGTAGLPPPSPVPSSVPVPLKKTDSFGMRVKHMGKKLASSSRKDEKLCTVTPVVRIPSDIDSPTRRSWSYRTPSPSQQRAPSPANTKTSRTSKADRIREQDDSSKLGSNNPPASFFSMADVESASNHLMSFLDTLADSLCADANSGDETETVGEVWQRSVPTVIGTRNMKRSYR